MVFKVQQLLGQNAQLVGISGPVESFLYKYALYLTLDVYNL